VPYTRNGFGNTGEDGRPDGVNQQLLLE